MGYFTILLAVLISATQTGAIQIRANFKRVTANEAHKRCRELGGQLAVLTAANQHDIKWNPFLNASSQGWHFRVATGKGIKADGLLGTTCLPMGTSCGETEPFLCSFSQNIEKVEQKHRKKRSHLACGSADLSGFTCDGSDLFEVSIYEACQNVGQVVSHAPYGLYCARTCCECCSHATTTPAPTVDPSTCFRNTVINDAQESLTIPEGSYSVGHPLFSGNEIRSAIGLSQDIQATFKLSWVSDRLFDVNNVSGDITLSRDKVFDFENGLLPSDTGTHPSSSPGRREIYIHVVIDRLTEDTTQDPRRLLVRRQVDCDSISFGSVCALQSGCTNDYSSSTCRNEHCEDYTQSSTCISNDCDWWDDYASDFSGLPRGACSFPDQLPSCEIFVVESQCTENARCSWRSSRRCTTNTFAPTAIPTGTTTLAPSSVPTTPEPSISPTTSSPTFSPSAQPSATPTEFPSQGPIVPNPTVAPSDTPSSIPSGTPTESSPTSTPHTSTPTSLPSQAPTKAPSIQPPCWGLERCRTVVTIGRPSCINLATFVCVENDTAAPCPNGGDWQRVCGAPTNAPTSAPTTLSPTTSMPTNEPTISPTVSPTSSNPTTTPTMNPTVSTVNPNVVTATQVSTTTTLLTTTTYNTEYGYRYFGNDPDYIEGGPPNLDAFGCDAVLRIVLHIGDENDNRPEIDIDSTFTEIEVSESANLGAVVFDFGAVVTDNDEGDSLTFGFVNVDNSDEFEEAVQAAGLNLSRTVGPFTMNPVTGVIYVAALLDREEVATYAVYLGVIDTTGLGSALPMSIVVVDENDNAPQFILAPQTLRIAENTDVGVTLAQFIAEDDDIGVYGNITYSVEPTGIFDIDADGNLFLIQSLQTVDLNFDINGEASINLGIRATDGGTRSTLTTVSVTVTDINNHDPEFTGPFVTVVDENLVSEFSFLVGVQDSDSALYGPITLSFVGVQPSILNSTFFRIDGHELVLIRQLDYEILPFGNATVTLGATDAGGRSSTAQFTFLVTNVNDLAPTLVSGIVLPNIPYTCGSTLNISELDSAGTDLLILTFEDADNQVEQLNYDITPSFGEFDLIPNQNQVTLRLASTLDREQTDSFLVVLTATDSGGLRSSPCWVNISINDQSDEVPVFTQSLYVVSSLQEVNVAPVPIYVTTIHATDRDSVDSGQLRYSFDPPDNPIVAIFALDSTTGVITVRAGATIDRDTGLVGFEFDVMATDTGNNVGRASVHINPIIDINDNAPRFFLAVPQAGLFFSSGPPPEYDVSLDGSLCDEGNFEVCQGQSVVQISTEDLDTGSVSYRLINSADSPLFNIDTSGAIVTTAGLDYEIQSIYRITVVAADGVHESLASVVIRVENNNDNDPIFSQPIYSGFVSEDAAVGTPILLVEAIDADESDTVSYILEQQYRNLFEFQGNQLVLRGSLDYETTMEYIIAITARDQGGRFGEATAIVNVNDTNDSPPTIRVLPFRVFVTEVAPQTTNLFTVVADDADTDPLFSYIKYSVVSTSPASVAFEVRAPNSLTRSGVNRIVGLRSQISYSQDTPRYELVIDALNSDDPNFSRIQSQLCAEASSCRAITSVEVVPFISADEDASKLRLDWRMPVDPCLSFDSSDPTKPLECANTIVDTFHTVWYRWDTSIGSCTAPCLVVNSKCECQIGLPTSGSVSDDIESATHTIEGLRGNVEYEFQLRTFETDVNRRNHTVHTSSWMSYQTLDYEISSMEAMVRVDDTLIQWAAPSVSNGAFVRYILCWTSEASAVELADCSSAENVREVDTEITSFTIESTDVGNVMVERETNLGSGDQPSYTRISALAVSSTVDVVPQASESDAGAESNIWIVLVAILAVIILTALFVYLQPRFKKAKSVDLVDPEKSEEIAMETLRNKLFSEEEEEDSPESAAVGPAGNKDNYWDYYTAERANQFYPDGANQAHIPYTEGEVGAGGYLDTKPVPITARSGGGYSRDSVLFEPAPLDLPSHTPRTQRKDGYSAAFQGRVRTQTTIDLAEIPSEVPKLLNTGGAMQQFDMIRREEEHNNSTFIEANQMHNRPKNRYMNVKAIDSSRVKLTGAKNPGDDYINANFVDGWRKKNAYIATQGPVPVTFSHFWQMIWEQRCCVIVMVTKEVEAGRLKCHQYWPTVNGNMIEGDFEIISKLEDTSNPAVVLRRFTLKNSISGETREICQVQMLSWPDQDAPESPKDFLDFLEQVRQLQGEGETQNLSGPAVVHCSAGIGRSGTFMCLDQSLKRLDQIGNVDVVVTVNHMRRQRANSVQTPVQYQFILEAIAYYAKETAGEERGEMKTGPLTTSEQVRLEFLAGQSVEANNRDILQLLQAIRS